MKKLLLNQKLVMAILLAITVTLTVCCSNDDDDKKTNETMLESLDKTKWVYDGIGFPAIYLRFNDNNTNFLELWAAMAEEECYFYSSSMDDSSITIVENSKTKLVVKATESSEYYSLMTITSVGERLNLKQEYYENGILDDTEVLVFNKTSNNLDNLTICDFGFKFQRRLLKQ